MSHDPVVSFVDEPLILVGPDDEVLGYESKDTCHDGEGILHRAFSIFFFDGQGRVLLQQRSPSKRLWGGYWSNGCCSHPRRGEEMHEAVQRRAAEELRIHDARYEYLFKFTYQARFFDVGSEHELCSVFVARHDGDVQVNANEIADWKYVTPEALDAELRDNPDAYTPWMKMEWARMRQEYWPRIRALWEGVA